MDEDKRTVEQIVEELKAKTPGIRLFQINVPDREDEIYIARQASWNEYKRLIGAVKIEADANELLVQKFLVHPAPNYEEIQTQWDPGLVVVLAQQIQKGMGFSSGASIKKL